MITSIVWTLATIVAYLVALRVNRMLRSHPLAHPVVLATAMLVAALAAFHVPYSHFADATAGITFMLTPATIALAVPLYRELRAIRGNALAIAGGIVAGSGTVVVSAMLLARWTGCNDIIVRSLAPKSVTTPVAMAISAQIGGAPELSAIFAVLSGVVRAMYARFALRRWGNRFAGIGVGTAAHGVGTAQLYALDRLSGAFSGLAMGLNAILTAIVLPVFFAWLAR